MSSNLRIALYYLCGVFAAAQLGKLAALAPLISADLGLGLATMALLTSLLEVFGATTGGVAGHQIPRLGLGRSLCLAVLALALGAVAAALAPNAWVLAAARVVESLGYLAVVVAAPVLIARAATGHRQAAAMALWSTFVPVGMAVGAWTYSLAAGWAGWRPAQGLSVVAGVALWLALRRADAGQAAATHAEEPPPGATGPLLWLLVAAFGAYAVAEVGLLALLPSLLHEGGLSLEAAGTWTAVAALANVPASALGAWLLRRYGTVSRRVALATGLSLALSGLLFLAVFRSQGSAAWQAPLAVLINAASGVFPSLVFAWLPLAAGGHHRLALASGRLTQFGASGALIGPPLMGALVEHGGWSAAGLASLGLSVLAIPPALMAWRRLARHDAHSPICLA
ncbi:Cyanate permease [Roseateles sp. YR242]|uniref:MFS transporter n=1 Tax=Roseateles sp. YR242 TaxID=1855305 RepID=UPI0008BC1468|nr:MFS transporter [Roseateles sp. YR242]SEK78241.1 Cyanate permease [Roseateles sp. YR242]